MGYTIRKLRKKDINENYFSLLSTLTTAPYPGAAEAEKMYRFLRNNRQTYSIFVVVSAEDEVIGTGTLLTERKFIRDLGTVGHIEDIVISKEYQGHGLGMQLIRYLTEKAKEKECYKVILACSEENQKFYEKCGYSKKEVMMALYN
ncbi:glucosamine-phosphate N-acetyltransferase [Nematocida minor]|uniref:glucosamine-phosphate N-acetyltransferase n=1 Tax=Nematocida minor TaxID=1912983 RepID=UPI00222075B0|nr:glucosamine-phosphate N-acetyltransferase [Nematocida minor]KAI5190223.1 glucosamine-phosphate N-acetyltransferase [Nematocida minor]